MRREKFSAYRFVYKVLFSKVFIKFINFSPSLQAKSCVHLNYGWWIELKTVLTMKRERRGAKQAGKAYKDSEQSKKSYGVLVLS